MKRTDRIKLKFTRNWNLPGKERLVHFLSFSSELKTQIKDAIIWLNTEDIALYITADNYIEWIILSTGTYEDEINKLIRISLKSGENALDIGGNIGLQSIRMSQSVGGDGSVYAFEPMNHLQEKFKKNISLNKADNVTLLPFALSDTESEADYSINKNAWNQGKFSLDASEKGTDKQTVHVKIADNLPEIKALNNLALIKIDVEGFEYHVLRGLIATLKRHQPRIIFEYDSNYWTKVEQDIEDCTTFLLSLGYTLYQITSVGCELITDIKKIKSGNIFCI